MTARGQDAKTVSAKVRQQRRSRPLFPSGNRFGAGAKCLDVGPEEPF
jgi:hypothetical protein